MWFGKRWWRWWRNPCSNVTMVVLLSTSCVLRKSTSTMRGPGVRVLYTVTYILYTVEKTHSTLICAGSFLPGQISLQKLFMSLTLAVCWRWGVGQELQIKIQQTSYKWKKNVIIKYSQCNSLYQRISVPWNGKNKQRRGFALRSVCNTKFLNGTYPSMATQVRL